MKRYTLLYFLLLSSLIASSVIAQTSSGVPRETVAMTDTILSWLPSDTESVIVAQGPYTIPSKKKPDHTEQQGLTGAEVSKLWAMTLPMVMFGLDGDSLGERLASRKALVAIEGSRHFRVPRGLGMMHFEGCEIVVFSEELGDFPNSFAQDAQRDFVGTEEISGQRILVFQKKTDGDIWTTLVAFPRPNVILVATDRNYLAETLARMQGKPGPRALPTSLPEWRHVNRQSQFWALRHYDPDQAAQDPTSPLHVSDSAFVGSDTRAIGLVFNLTRESDARATIVYLSQDEGLLDQLNRGRWMDARDPDLKDLHPKFRALAPGVVEGSFEFEKVEPTKIFYFTLLFQMGHAILV